jgi:hypothetical protein
VLYDITELFDKACSGSCYCQNCQN